MSQYRICVVSGWCGNLRIIVADHLNDILNRAGYRFLLEQQSVWENPDPPTRADLVLQLLPAFTESDTGCPVIDIKALLRDLDHQPTITKIIRQIESDYTAAAAK